MNYLLTRWWCHCGKKGFKWASNTTLLNFKWIWTVSLWTLRQSFVECKISQRSGRCYSNAMVFSTLRIISIDTDEGDGSKDYRVLYSNNDIFEEATKELWVTMKIHLVKMVDSIVPAFDLYWLIGNCKTKFTCQHTCEVFHFARIFDRSFVSVIEACCIRQCICIKLAIKPLAWDSGGWHHSRITARS